MPPYRFSFSAVAAVALLAGCHRTEPRVYLAPKEPLAEAEQPAVATPGGAEPKKVAAPHPQVAYDAPEDWKPTDPGQLGGIGFDIDAPAGKATVKVTPMSSFAGREEMLVNMWRNQVGAAPVSPEEARQALGAVDVGGAQGQIFEVNGAQQGKAIRIVTAMLDRPDGTWFFKLAGDDAAVNAQKPAFVAFLKTFRFREPGSAVDEKPKSE